MMAKYGRALAATGLAGGLLIVFCALPPFRTGIWYQSEPVSAALHAVSACVALGLGLGLLAGDRRAGAAVWHPFVAIPAAMAAWSLITLPFAAVPMLSWFGAPEQGEGIAWFLDLAILIAGGRWICRHRLGRRALAWLALAAIVGATALTLHTESRWAWAPFLAYDYLAFYGIFGSLLLYTFLRPRKNAWQAAIWIFGAAVVVASGNRAAILVVAVVAPAVWFLCHTLRVRRRLRKSVATIAVAGTPLLMLAAVIGAGMAAPSSSLWSRMMHLKVTAAALADQPVRWLTGYGWGNYGDQLIRKLPVELVAFTFEGKGSVNWDALDGPIHFHTHNFLAEALLAIGIVGLMLAWGLLVSVPWLCRRRDTAIAAAGAASIGAISAIWFQLPGSLPYMALALTGLSRPGTLRPRPVRHFAIIGAVVLAVCASQVVTTWSIIRTGAAMMTAAFDNTDVAELADRPRADCATFLDDHGRGGIHLANLFRSYLSDLDRTPRAGHAIQPQHAARLADYICAFHRQIRQPHSLRLAVAGLIARTELVLLLDDPTLTATSASFVATWGQALKTFLDQAPSRSDLAVPYLNLELSRANDRAVMSVAGQLLAHNRRDPVGLWFSGNVLLTDPARVGDGFARLNLSLDLGLERLMPVDPALRAQIRGAVGRK